jgi:hypothetical protein
MTLKRLLFDGTDGTTATTGNTGAASLSALGGGTLVLANSVGEHSTTGLLATSVGTNACSGRFTPVGPGKTMSFRGTLRSPSVAPAAGQFHVSHTFRRSGGVKTRLRWTETGTLQLADGSSGQVQTIATGLSWGTKYDVSMRLVVGTATTSPYDGVVNVVVRDMSGTTLGSYAASNYNLGTEDVAEFDLGVVTSNGGAHSVGWEDVQIDDGNTAEIPPYVPGAQSGSYTGTVTATGFTPTGGTAQAVLADASDASLVTSIDNPTAATAVLSGTLVALAPPTGDFTVRIRGRKTGASSGTYTVKVKVGATTIATKTATIPDALGASDVVFTTTDLAAMSAGDWAAVTLEVAAAAAA